MGFYSPVQNKTLLETTSINATCTSTKVELYLHFSICLRGIVLNYLSTATIPFTIQGVPGGRVNIVGDQSIGRFKQKSV